MSETMRERLDALSLADLARLRRGIEKESLRVRPDGTLATTPHPRALGSALTHPHITTDFSESQLELVTGVHTSAEACIRELEDIHRFVYRHIGDELLWAASMPCYLPDEPDIPIARFGTSNVGRAKTVYRTGLSYRYGRRMQTISGIHYNFSLPQSVWPLPGLEDANAGYFSLIRNFRRRGWMLMYPFGASPAVCASFVAGRLHNLVEFGPGTLYLPGATSLRMGRLGYLSEAQDSLSVSSNDLPSYAASLQDALTQPYPPYEVIGIRDGDSYRQLAVSLLQIENEFYSTIRPKRVIRPAERPLHALRERGVEYVEVRALDLDPFSAIGIGADTARFLDIFLLHCLLTDSPPDNPQEIVTNGRNKQLVAARGRERGLRLQCGGEEIELAEWADRLLVEFRPVALALDVANGGSAYCDALDRLARAADAPDSLPSARVLNEMRERYGGSHGRFGLGRSCEHRELLTSTPLPAEIEARFARLAQESIEEQRRIEATDELPFEEYRLRYLSKERLGVD
ncbi:MAG TPA: glutamate--cysteine ligase [Burkholderiales bacterium]|nr:glutamate--cysteine ligase [Burkholderiales bacterium]